MKNTTWKKLGQKVLLKHTRLDVFEDEVRLPDGHITKYIHYTEKHDAAMAIAVREDGKILLQREYSYPPNKWLYQFPGGGIEKNEINEAAAVRELSEEAGYTTVDIEYIGNFYLNNRRDSRKFFVYLATNLVKKKAQGDIEEDIETFWFTEQEIDNMIKNGEIVNSLALAGWALFKARSS